MSDNFSIQLVTEVGGTGGNGTVYVMSDGHLYIRHSSTQFSNLFRCKYFRNGCPGKVRFHEFGLNILTSAHDHDPTAVSHLAYRTYVQSLLNDALKLTHANLKDIIYDPRNANHLHKLEGLLPSVMRLREKNLPNCENLRDLCGILRNSPDLSFMTGMHHFQETLYQGFAESTDQSQVILFIGKNGHEFLQMISSVSLVHIPVPHRPEQYKMCVVAALSQRQVIPLAWIVSEKYTYQALCAGFQLLKSTLSFYHFTSIISAVDEAGYAFAHVFCVGVSPSLYDFIEDILSSEDTGFTKESLKDNLALDYIVKLCCALPLLPPDQMQIGVNFIVKESLLFGEEIHYQAVLLFHYIEEKWFKNPHIQLSVYDNVDRTNIGCADLRSRIGAALQRSKKIGLYFLVNCIASFASRAEKDIGVTLANARPTRLSPVPLLAQTDVLNLLDEVVKPSLNTESAVRNLLLAVRTKIQHLF